MTQDLGASANAEPGSRASTEPCSTVSALTGFDPARLAANLSYEMLFELRNVAEGKPTVPGFGSAVWHLKCLGYVEERTINKPCKTCGTPQHDYSYNKITAAGREVLAASAIEAASAGETPQSGSTEGESAVAKPDAQGPSQ